MSLGSNNPFPSVLTVEQGSTPTSPASGRQRLFIRSSDHHVCRVNSSGTVTDLEGGIGAGAVGGGFVSEFRLTLETGVPVSTTDQIGKSTLYFTPAIGALSISTGNITLWNGSTVVTVSMSEIALALSGLTSGKNYDVFVDYNSGTPQLVLSAAWSSDTARTDALGDQSGLIIKSGTPAYRWVGTIRTTGTTTTEDSGGIAGTSQTGAKRFVWNAYNQIARQIKVIDTTDSWSYTTNTVRQANGASGNKVEWVSGHAAGFVQVRLWASVRLVSNSANAAKAGVGIDTTTAFSGVNQRAYFVNGNNEFFPIGGEYDGMPGLGYHYASWNEKGADGTCEFQGDAGGDSAQSGLTGTIWN